jgi:hypothetical protein
MLYVVTAAVMGGCRAGEENDTRVYARDGTAYELRYEGSGMQDVQMVLYRIGEDGDQRVDVRPMDSPRIWVPIVRVDGQRKGDATQLYLAPNGLLLGLKKRNQCYLIYDTVSQKALPVDNSMSPFVLHDAQSVVYWPDVQYVLENIAAIEQRVDGFPQREILERCKSHPNRSVRKASMEIFNVLNKL